MITATISDKKTGSELYRDFFTDADSALKWFQYNVPSADLSALRPNTKLEVDGVYILAMKQDEELPSATTIDVKANEELPSKGAKK